VRHALYFSHPACLEHGTAGVRVLGKQVGAPVGAVLEGGCVSHHWEL
jgi:hypothetical protein